jgi:hypothetical protein
MTDGNVAYLLMVLVVFVAFMGVLAWAEKQTRE